MIEKLDLDNGYTTVDWLPTQHGKRCGAKEIQTTVNQLVDAVNDITDWIKRTDETIVKCGIKPIPEKIAQGFKNLQDHRPNMVMDDPYAEQRKWIGCVCRFWDIDNNNLYYGPLTKIHYTSPYCYECNHKICYAFCEPVKDDVIYKGGDNE